MGSLNANKVNKNKVSPIYMRLMVNKLNLALSFTPKVH